mgnify:CR=1 FL=1
MKYKDVIEKIYGKNSEVYHSFDPKRCDSCRQLFAVLVRDMETEQIPYCSYCFGHKYSYKQVIDVLNKLDEVARILWSTPLLRLIHESEDLCEYIFTPAQMKRYRGMKRRGDEGWDI